MELSISNIVALSEISASYARAHGLKSLLDLEILEFVYKNPRCTREELMLGTSYSGPWSRVKSLKQFFNVEHEHTKSFKGTCQYVVELTNTGKWVYDGFEKYMREMLLEGNFDIVIEDE